MLLSPRRFRMKTQMCRFQIHDELTAPEASLPVLKGALAGGGQLPNFLGVLAGSPAALRGYARFRSELRNGTLPLPTLERIALAVAEQHRSRARARAARAHRPPGRPRPRRDRARPRVGLARRARGRAAALPAPARRAARPCPSHLHEEAREAGWSDEQLLEAIAVVALEILHGDGQRRRRRAGRRLGRGRRACCAPRRPWRRAPPPQGRDRDARTAGGSCCPYLHEARRAGRQALDRARSSPCCCEGGADALLGDRAARSRTSPTGCCPSG